MIIKDWKREVFTIPNLLSLFRIALIPIYTHIYLHAAKLPDYYLAGGILALSCITDLIDGKIARHFHMISKVGKVLDPVADKLTQFTLTLCLSVHRPALRPVLTLFVIKESFQLVAMIANLRRGKALPGALTAGKVCTTVLFVSLIAMVIFPDMNNRLSDLIALICGIFLCISFFSYILAYFGKNTRIQDLDLE